MKKVTKKAIIEDLNRLNDEDFHEVKMQMLGQRVSEDERMQLFDFFEKIEKKRSKSLKINK